MISASSMTTGSKYCTCNILGRQPGPHVVPEAEKLLSASLEKIETFWLKENGQFLLGNSQPSIADLSLVCEIMQLEVNGFNLCWQLGIDIYYGRGRIAIEYYATQESSGSGSKITKLATRPHFEEIHGVLYQVKAKLQKQRLLGANTET
ncbi:glutathione S-transferase T1-like [Camellia sinensis]|uniref:glutathione S-transferase T1-like n=1 Tax=Camellia sinensis TaxID=4442 RepID=UPI0010366785|nr:glutathione S-transferase T1-like [Camellia sinensis]